MSSPARALAILNLFSKKRPVWHADSINETLGYTRTTGYRYVKDLVDAGMLQKVSVGHYSLGARIIELDYQLRTSDPLLLAAVPAMSQLMKRARLDVVLTTMFGMRVIDIYRASIDPNLEQGYGRGRPRSLFKGAAPKLILAFLSRPRLVKIHAAYAREAARCGVGKSWTEFRAYFAELRRDAFYISRSEFLPGAAGAAVPLLGADGEPLGALALVGSLAAIDAVPIKRLRAMLEHARSDIEQKLAAGAG